MSETKHTQGPWAVDDSHKHDDGLYVEAPNRTDYICTLGAAIWDTSAACGQITEEDEANARLIAAAPDLLAAAKNVLGECLDTYLTDRIMHVAAMDAWEALSAAIAKAEGR